MFDLLNETTNKLDLSIPSKMRALKRTTKNLDLNLKGGEKKDGLGDVG